MLDPTAEADQAFGPGRLVDHFRLVRRIGQGGMGEVWLARDTRLGRKVALKVVLPERIGSDTAVERFLFEARTTALFNHPHIVAIHAVGEVDGQPYVALEYVEGETLRDRMRSQPPSPREAMRLLLATAEALQEAHAGGVLHRDLKPENIMLGRDGRLRVLDFGLARSIARDSADPDPDGDSDKLMGTPAYMSPEQWNHEESTPACDIWALGVIGYELLSGHRPYPVTRISALSSKVLAPEPVPPLDAAGCDAPEDLVDLVLRCLDKSPEARPSAEEVAAELESLVHGTTTGRGRAEQNPFRGLLPFTERQAGMYFGRDEEIALAVERLRTAPILPIVGPSGAGKSSFVQAGVVPRLREQSRWLVLRMRPGTSPLQTLASRLVSAGSGATWDSARTRPSAPSDAGGGLQAAPTPTANAVSGRLTATAPGEETPAGDDPALVRTAAAESPALARTAAETLPGDGAAGGMAATVAGDVADDGDDAGDGRDESDAVPGGVSTLETVDADLVAQRLSETPGRLNLLLHRLAEARGSRVLLFVDQLEELYTLVGDPAIRRAFMQAICTAADDPEAPVRVVFTVRDDFLGQIAEGEEVRRALGRVVVMRAPGPDALRETLLRPVRLSGYTFQDDAVVDAMVAAVRGEAAALPLLQFAARMLFEARDRERRIIPTAAYEAIGGVEGALAQHADSVLDGLPASGVGVAREILLRLTTEQRTRRVRPRQEVLDGLPDEAQDVLGRLVEARLVSVRKGSGDTADEARLEVVHESLLLTWGRLSRWIDESEGDLGALQELEAAAERWAARGRHDDDLWRGAPLHDALRLRERMPQMPELARRFVRAGERVRDRRKRRTRLALAGTVLGLIGVIVFLLAQWETARDATRTANAATDRAEAQRAAAERARAEVEARNADLVLAQARSALEVDPTRTLAWLATIPDEARLWGEAFGLAWQARGRGAAQEVLTGHTDEVRWADVSPDGRWVATASYDHTARLWDLETRTFRVLAGHDDELNTVAFRPSGELLVTASRDKTLRLWRLDGTSRVLRGHTDAVHYVTWFPAGDRLASAGADGTVRVWSAEGELLRTLESEGPQDHLVVARDGTWLAAGGATGQIRIWDLEGGGSRLLTGHEGDLQWLALSEDEKLLASASRDRTVRVWDLEGGSVRVLRGHTHEVRLVAFQPGGRLLASGSRDATIGLWDLATGEHRVLEGHEGVIRHLAFSPDGARLASTSDDRSVRVWDVDSGTAQVYLGHGNRVRHLAWSDDGTLLVSAGGDSAARIWRTRDGVPGLLHGMEGRATYATVSPDGRFVAGASRIGEIRLWELATGHSRAVGRHTDLVYELTFSPDGRLLASAGRDRRVGLWPLDAGGSQAPRFLKATSKVSTVALSPDGHTIAAATRGTRVPIWDLETGQRRDLAGHEDKHAGAVFSGDGRWLATASVDRTVRIWNVETGEARVLRGFEDEVFALARSPEGDRVAAAGGDGTVRIWPFAGGDPTVLRGHEGTVTSLAFAPDGQRLATGSLDRTVRVWDLSTGASKTLGSHAKAVATVTWASDSLVASGSEDRTVRIWDLRTGESHVLGGDGSPVQHLAATPDGAYVIAATDHPVLQVWPTAIPHDPESVRAWIRKLSTARFGPDDVLRSDWAEVPADTR